MNAEGRLEQSVACLVHVIGRATVKEEIVREIVGTAVKQQRAFNLCDGTRTQSQIRKSVGLDTGNFSRTARRWIEHGVVFEMADGTDAKLLHLYPLGKSKRGSVKRSKRSR